ncbi:hypothetical protein Tco_1451092 [Tanacetum coccineum]
MWRLPHRLKADAKAAIEVVDAKAAIEVASFYKCCHIAEKVEMLRPLGSEEGPSTGPSTGPSMGPSTGPSRRRPGGFNEKARGLLRTQQRLDSSDGNARKRSEGYVINQAMNSLGRVMKCSG